MKVIENKRWGEILIRKATDQKNVFDKIKSFSVEQTKEVIDIEDYRILLKITTDLTQKYSVKKLMKKLKKL